MTKKQRRLIGKEPAKLGTFAGHRTGKRKRGVSVLRKQPKATTSITTYYVKDEDGITVASINTFRYSREQDEQ